MYITLMLLHLPKARSVVDGIGQSLTPVSLRAFRANDCREITGAGICDIITPALILLELASRRSIGDEMLYVFTLRLTISH